MKIELIGAEWGNFGSPERGSIVEAEWHPEIGPTGAWSFDTPEGEWYATPGSPTGAWTAQESTDTEEETA